MNTECRQVTPLHFFRSNNAPRYGRGAYYTADRMFMLIHLPSQKGWQIYPSNALTAANRRTASLAHGSGLCSEVFQRRRDAIAALKAFLHSEEV